jgi:hypothetical protein
MNKIFNIIFVFNLAILAQILIPFLVINDAYSQYKGSINKAETYLNKSELKSDIEEKRSLLIDAKGEIDLAMTIQKNNIKARSWYIQGNIYSAIAKQFLDIDPDAIEKAAESFNKIIDGEIKTNNIEILQNSITKKDNLRLYFINNAIQYQQSNPPEFELSLEEWENVLLVNPLDTLAMEYTAFVAGTLKDYKYAVEKYTKVINSEEIGINAKFRALQQCVDFTFNKCEIFDDCSTFSKAIGFIKIGLELFPNDNFFKQVEINILIITDKADEAINKTNKLIESDPDNPAPYFNKGVFYYNMGVNLTSQVKDYNFTQKQLDNIDSIFNIAIDAYSKNLELDPLNSLTMQYLIYCFNASGEPYIKMKNFLAYDVLEIKKFAKKQNQLNNDIKSRIGRGIGLTNNLITEAKILDETEIQSIYSVFKFSEEYKLAIDFLNSVTEGKFWKEGVNHDPKDINYYYYIMESYNKLNDDSNAEKIDKIICDMIDGTWTDQYGCEEQ